MNFTINTSNLSLQTLTSQDAAKVLDFFKRNKDFFEPWEPNLPDSFYTLNFQATSLNYEYQQIVKGKEVRYWIFLKEEPDTIIGTISFSNICRGSYQSCIIGYKVDSAYANHGIIYEALSSTIPAIFTYGNLHRIEAFIHPNNIPSIALAKKLGFFMEGTARQIIKLDNVWTDHYRYSLVNDISLYQ